MSKKIMDTVTIIFSYNRAFQLDATLRSYIFHCKDFVNSRSIILYKADTDLHQKQYEKLKEEYKTIKQVRFAEESDFKKNLISFLAAYRFVLFLVDDNIFVNSFRICDLENLLDTEDDIIGISLRLGENTNYCYSLDQTQQVPDFKTINGKFRKFSWTNSVADFGYPLELSSSIYRIDLLLPLLWKIPFENPNTLEANLDANKNLFNQGHPYLISYHSSRTFCAPVNKVQNIAEANRSGDQQHYSPEELAKQFDTGHRLDISAYLDFLPNACHQEVKLKTLEPYQVNQENNMTDFQKTVNDETVQTITNNEFSGKAPFVSIIIPCYKQADLVLDALESVLQQSYKNWECIVVNDGSPDNTSEVTRNFINKNPAYSIKLLEVKNGGLSSARNRGIENSSGEYILPLDSDDKIHPDYVKRCVETLEAMPDITIVYCDRQDFGLSDQSVSAADFSFKHLVQGNILSYCSMYHRSVWDDANGYDESLNSYEDWNFWISACKHGHKAYHIPELLFYYRVKEESMYTEALERDHLLKSQIVQNHPEFYTKELLEKAKTIYQAEEPLVSVIVPTYNRPDMLNQAIESIVNQRYQNIEVIVINDAGKDVSHILEKYNDKLKIKYHCNLKNLKLSASRNVGLKLSEGKYITYLDDDDIFYENHIETLVNFLQRSRYKVAYTDGNRAIQKKSDDGSYHVIKRENILSNDFSREYLLITNITPVCCVMHERSCIDTVGIFDERLRTLEDWDFWIRMSLHFDFKHIKEISCEYRQRLDESNSTTSEINFFRHSERIILLNNLRFISPGSELMKQVINRINALNEVLSYNDKGEPFFTENDNPLVSIIVPTYNRPDTLQRTLSSLAEQSYDNIEVLLINDAGQDVKEIALAYQGKLNIRYFVNSINSGLAATRNIGLKNANGKYITYLDDDDIFYEKHVEILVSKLENSIYKIAYTDALRAIEEKSGDTYLLKNKVLDQSQDFDRNLLIARNITPVCCVMHERSCVDTVGYFREDFFAHEDWEYWIRMSEHYDFIHIPEVSSEFYHRIGNDNMTTTRQDEFNRTRIIIYETYMNRVAENHDITTFINNELKNLRKLIPKQETESGVSIIILTYKTRDLTKKCIESILKFTKEKYEIILVDNASEDGSLQVAKDFANKHEHIRLIENKKNEGFSKGNNIGAADAKYDYLLLLNNDIEITNTDWLKNLSNVLDQDKNVAVAGAKLIYPDGTLQHAGVMVVDDRRQHIPINCFHINYQHRDEYDDIPLETQAVTGACFLIRTKVYQQLNGLSEDYWNGYEDVDLCFRVRELGYKIVYEPKSVSIHHESKSGKQRYLKAMDNIDLLHERWLEKIRPDHVICIDKKNRSMPNAVLKEYKGPGHNPANAENKDSIAIIIVSYFSEDTIIKCLQSVEQTTEENVEVFIVDNNSQDKTVELVNQFIENKPRFWLIQNDENRGFSEAINIGVQYSAADFIVFLNPDTVVSPAWTELLLKVIKSNEEVAAVGPVSNYAYGLQNLINYLSKEEAEPCKTIDDLSYKLREKYENSAMESTVLIGFCTMVRREALCKIGLLDNRLFLGNDDLDLSWRLRVNGYKLLVATSCYVYHEGQHSFKKAGKSATEKLVKESTEILYRKLKRYYSDSGVPEPEKLWQVNWFKPVNAHFNPDASIMEISELNIRFLNLEHKLQVMDNEQKLNALSYFLEKYPNHPLALEELAVLSWNNKQYESAVELIETSIKVNPNNESAFIEFIDMLLNLNMKKEAYDFLNQYLEKKPDHEDSLVRLQNIYLESSNLPKARETIEKLIRINPMKDEYTEIYNAIR